MLIEGFVERHVAVVASDAEDGAEDQLEVVLAGDDFHRRVQGCS